MIESPPLLSVQNLTAGYSSLEVVHDVTFSVPRGQLTCLIGANGAGKSTSLKAVTGLHRASSGKILLNGKEIQNLKPHKISRERLAFVPEGRKVFPGLTTLQNLHMGSYSVPGAWKNPDELEKTLDLFPELRKVLSSQAGLLSGGQQQMLAIGRALMSQPEVLVLDEPSMGLSPILVERIFEALKILKNNGTTMLLAEQNASLALQLADWVCVLELGVVVETGSASELANSSRVEEIYFGKNSGTN